MDLGRLSDLAEIQGLLATYVEAIDSKDFDRLDTVFTPDATFDYSATGGAAGSYAEIKPWLARALAPFPLTQHLIGLPLIQLNGDEARARTMLFNPMLLQRSGEDHLFFVGATYVDDLVRTAAGWRIARRVEANAWAKDPPRDHISPGLAPAEPLATDRCDG
jgi:hypothetical protein